MTHGRSDTDLAFIKAHAAEGTEAKTAAESVLIGNLDSESFSAGGAPRAIKVEQRTEHESYANGSHRGQNVAVRDSKVGDCGEHEHGWDSKHEPQRQESSRSPRAYLKVFPDRHEEQSYAHRPGAAV
jgi:hypothetical protein